jgi:monofunctional biosynthetic peptidoglycan transglycosylase
VLDRIYRARDPASNAKRLRQPRARVAAVIMRVVAVLIMVPLALILAYRFVPVPITPLMVIRMIQGQPLRHQWVAYERISPALPHALIASEDNLFCEETLGFDVAAMRGQVDAWEDGRRPRGASTITMQTAKNLLLWPGRDPIRKLIETWLTPQIALLWPKRRVLEVYLNIVEFGPGIYGAEAAAGWFFRKPAAELTPREAAQLVSVLPRPLRWVAAPPGPYVRLRAGVIERRAGQLGSLLACAG